MKKISIILISLMFSFSTFGFKTILFTEGNNLFVFSGGSKKKVASGVTYVCAPYFLKGDKLYFFLMDSGRYIDTGVTKLFRGSYLKGNKLYALYGMNSKFVSDRVSRVFGKCMD